MYTVNFLEYKPNPIHSCVLQRNNIGNRFTLIKRANQRPLTKPIYPMKFSLIQVFSHLKAMFGPYLINLKQTNKNRFNITINFKE